MISFPISGRCLWILCVLGLSDCVLSYPAPEAVTSGPTTNVRYVGVLQKDQVDWCMAVFLTHRSLGTSCRCLGDTSNSGFFTKFDPSDFKVRSWGKGQQETQQAEKFFYYEMCGVEANKVLMDLGVVQTAQAFSEGAATPIGIPDASVFRFYEYIYVSTKRKTNCVSTTLNQTAAQPGETVVVQLQSPASCQFRKVCNNQADIIEGKCVLPTLTSNYICGLAETNCTVTSGAPLVCHGMLVGINAGTRECNTVINPSLYARIDFTMMWLQSVVCNQ